MELSTFTTVLTEFDALRLIEVSSAPMPCCGAVVLWVFHTLLCQQVHHPLRIFRICLALRFESCTDLPPMAFIQWGFGPGGQLVQQLATELFKHANVAEGRAADAIKAIGNDQIINALAHRQTWKQLKLLGNNVKFQFVMPSELAQAVDDNKGKQVGGKGKGKSKSKAMPPAAALDPSKLQILDNTFCAQGHPCMQLHPNQIGPLCSGVILMSHQDAEPFLRTGQTISQEPLAIAVLARTGLEVHTSLPHARVTIPCRCTVDQEPVLVDGFLVQLGTGLVEKKTTHALVQIDSLDVVTLKVLVSKDAIKGDWTEFCTSPIRHFVSLASSQCTRCSGALVR